jgi:hypothetical protein
VARGRRGELDAETRGHGDAVCYLARPFNAETLRYGEKTCCVIPAINTCLSRRSFSEDGERDYPESIGKGALRCVGEQRSQ